MTEARKQKKDDGRQMTEGRRKKLHGRRQPAENRRRNTDDKARGALRAICKPPVYTYLIGLFGFDLWDIIFSKSRWEFWSSDYGHQHARME